ncbi:MAG: hypothetical protein D6760_02475 [Deltaproteobacteria bacterium]|nr:MAG: hypothetical protein D6760_02475 [Deltaproteobacteria bacterium]
MLKLCNRIDARANRQPRSGTAALALLILGLGALPARAAAAGAECPEPDRDSAEGAARRVLCLVEHDHALDAIVYGEDAAARWPGEARLLSALGRAYDESGNRDRALAYQEEAHRRAPRDPLISYRLASVLADEVDRLAPVARGETIPADLRHCFASAMDSRDARKKMKALARRADRLYARSIEGFSRTRGEDDILTLNARMERALLHVTLDGRKAIPELEAVAADYRRIAETIGDPAMADMASGVYMNLAQSYALYGDDASARKALDEAAALAATPDQKRLVAASAGVIEDGNANSPLIAAMAGSSDCTLTTDRATPGTSGEK